MEGFKLFWEYIENVWMQVCRIIIKSCLMMLLMSAIISVGSPWYSPMSTIKTNTFKLGIYMFFMCWIYPELKSIFLHHKKVFTEGKK